MVLWSKSYIIHKKCSSSQEIVFIELWLNKVTKVQTMEMNMVSQKCKKKMEEFAKKKMLQSDEEDKEDEDEIRLNLQISTLLLFMI